MLDELKDYHTDTLYDLSRDLEESLDECDFGSYEYDCLNTELQLIELELERRSNLDNGVTR